MIKKCVIKYDELGKPIELVELKEFNDPRVLSEFKESCLVNKKDYLKRLEDVAKQKEEKEKQLYHRIENLEKGLEKALLLIKHSLGYEELSEEQLKELLGVEEHEEEN